jgi:hypothetical protein
MSLLLAFLDQAPNLFLHYQFKGKIYFCSVSILENTQLQGNPILTSAYRGPFILPSPDMFKFL